MRKTLLILSFVILNSSFSIAQEWFPVGAKWTYAEFFEIGPYYSEDPYYARVVADTTVFGVQCKKIVDTSPFRRKTYRHYSNEKVYYVDPLRGDTAWNLFYDFSALVGDTIWYPQFPWTDLNGVSTVYHVIVDSIFSIILNGDTLKGYYATEQVGSGLGPGHFAQFALERVTGGEVEWYSGEFGNGGPGPLGLRCYQDSILGFWKDPNFNLDCDTSFTLVGLTDGLEKKNSIRVFPVPAKNYLKVSISSKLSYSTRFKIFDLNGRIVKSAQIRNPDSDLDISNLKPGIYIWEFSSEKGRIRDKLIIQ